MNYEPYVIALALSMYRKVSPTIRAARVREECGEEIGSVLFLAGLLERNPGSEVAALSPIAGVKYVRHALEHCGEEARQEAVSSFF